MKWTRFDLGSKDDVLEFFESQNYKFQAELIKLEPIFGSHIFGNFELNVTVFDLDGIQIENFSLEGLNGKMNAAIKQLEALKNKALSKYNLQ